MSGKMNQTGVMPCFRPGFVLPVFERHVTQSVIDAYARASGDFNPIHVDPDYAGKGPFGRTIAHGLMTLAYAAQMLNDWSVGGFDETGEIEVAFVGPVFADDHIEMSGTVEDLVTRNGRLAARCTLVCRCGERKILAGTVYQPVENEKVS
ncbi:MaoC family dehydratase [Hoeflea ulvae]|uniref:MaoC family dehydratase n=1 Tax=Hoeflea ulvae TaxID=2983764 RepID=A0ABT3YLQ5_9HYPH|nr:MaoC family dehydratase [Hoeflea ulvae]MCY0096835.1 MaoC family dehydratase [Hoeflea ulvae]